MEERRVGISEMERVTLEGIADLCALGGDPARARVARRTMWWCGQDPEVDYDSTLDAAIEYAFEVREFWSAEGHPVTLVADDHGVVVVVFEQATSADESPAMLMTIKVEDN